MTKEDIIFASLTDIKTSQNEITKKIEEMNINLAHFKGRVYGIAAFISLCIGLLGNILGKISL